MIETLNPYNLYENSSASWLGKIPAHWNILNLRTILKNVATRNRPDLPLLSVVREKGVIIRDISSKDENHNFIPDELTNYKVVHAGQFAMNKMKAWQGSFGVSQFDGIVSPAYFVFDLNGVDGRFFHTAIRSKLYVHFFNQASDGVRIGQWDLAQTRMREIPFFIPPPDEQAAIVRYLDHVDRDIRKYIRAKQNLIKLLEEQKQAIIHRAVTRGLDPNVPLKPSGVDWLGDVPAHWDVTKGKYIGRLFSTSTINDNNLTDNAGTNAMYLKVSDLVGLDQSFIVRKSNLYVNDSSEHNRETRWPWIVFPKRGAAIFTNKVAITNQRCFLDPNLMGWEINGDFDPMYVALVLKARTLTDIADVSSVPQINNKHIYPLPLPAPPLNEQQVILEKLNNTLSKLTTLIDGVNLEVSFIQEYRTRLIADVVTGKVDVREIAANLPEIEGTDTESEVIIDGDLTDTDDAEYAEEDTDADE